MTLRLLIEAFITTAEPAPCVVIAGALISLFFARTWTINGSVSGLAACTPPLSRMVSRAARDSSASTSVITPLLRWASMWNISSSTVRGNIPPTWIEPSGSMSKLTSCREPSLPTATIIAGDTGLCKSSLKTSMNPLSASVFKDSFSLFKSVVPTRFGMSSIDLRFEWRSDMIPVSRSCAAGTMFSWARLTLVR